MKEAGGPLAVAYFGPYGRLPWLVLADRYWCSNEQTQLLIIKKKVNKE